MSPPSLIDLILSLGLLLHIYLCFMWSHKNQHHIFKILKLPNRNYLATRAWSNCLFMLTFLAVIYALVLWRFYMLLGALGAWGSSATVLMVLVCAIAAYRLWHRVYFERLINEAVLAGN